MCVETQLTKLVCWRCVQIRIFFLNYKLCSSLNRTTRKECQPSLSHNQEKDSLYSSYFLNKMIQVVIIAYSNFL